jgi:hypothetical protein
MREVVGSNPTATTMLSLAVEKLEELLKEIQYVEQKIRQESGVIREPGEARRSGRADY